MLPINNSSRSPSNLFLHNSTTAIVNSFVINIHTLGGQRRNQERQGARHCSHSGHACAVAACCATGTPKQPRRVTACKGSHGPGAGSAPTHCVLVSWRSEASWLGLGSNSGCLVLQANPPWTTRFAPKLFFDVSRQSNRSNQQW